MAPGVTAAVDRQKLVVPITFESFAWSPSNLRARAHSACHDAECAGMFKPQQLQAVLEKSRQQVFVDRQPRGDRGDRRGAMAAIEAEPG